jgi:hypothetical protein
MTLKTSTCLASLALAALTGVPVAMADDDFYGIVQSRPAGKVGTWVIGGRSFEATRDTDLDEDDGPLRVGACAEVYIDDGRVEEIETEPLRDCR